MSTIMQRGQFVIFCRHEVICFGVVNAVSRDLNVARVQLPSGEQVFTNSGQVISVTNNPLHGTRR